MWEAKFPSPMSASNKQKENINSMIVTLLLLLLLLIWATWDDIWEYCIRWVVQKMEIELVELIHQNFLLL